MSRPVLIAIGATVVAAATVAAIRIARKSRKPAVEPRRLP